MPAFPVSTQRKQRLLSHQIISHLNTHIVGILQINLIRILLPGVPPGVQPLTLRLNEADEPPPGRRRFRSLSFSRRRRPRVVKMESPGRLRFQHQDAARELVRADGLSLEEAPRSRSWLAGSRGRRSSPGALSSDVRDRAAFHNVILSALK